MKIKILILFLASLCGMLSYAAPTSELGKCEGGMTEVDLGIPSTTEGKKNQTYKLVQRSDGNKTGLFLKIDGATRRDGSRFDYVNDEYELVPTGKTSFGGPAGDIQHYVAICPRGSILYGEQFMINKGFTFAYFHTALTGTLYFGRGQFKRKP